MSPLTPIALRRALFVRLGYPTAAQLARRWAALARWRGRRVGPGRGSPFQGIHKRIDRAHSELKALRRARLKAIGVRGQRGFNRSRVG